MSVHDQAFAKTTSYLFERGIHAEQLLREGLDQPRHRFDDDNARFVPRARDCERGKSQRLENRPKKKGRRTRSRHKQPQNCLQQRIHSRLGRISQLGIRSREIPDLRQQQTRVVHGRQCGRLFQVGRIEIRFDQVKHEVPMSAAEVLHDRCEVAKELDETGAHLVRDRLVAGDPPRDGLDQEH